jgi:hypothetical protein
MEAYGKSRARLDTPLPLGYSSAGVVTDVGRGVKGVRVGDRVACSGSGYASHAEVVGVPRNLCSTPCPPCKDGELRSVEVALPVVRTGCILVRTTCSLVSVGTERAMIDVAQKSLLGKALARPDLVRQVIAKAQAEGILEAWREAVKNPSGGKSERHSSYS